MPPLISRHTSAICRQRRKSFGDDSEVPDASNTTSEIINAENIDIDDEADQDAPFDSYCSLQEWNSNDVFKLNEKIYPSEASSEQEILMLHSTVHSLSLLNPFRDEPIRAQVMNLTDTSSRLNASFKRLSIIEVVQELGIAFVGNQSGQIALMRMIKVNPKVSRPNQPPEYSLQLETWLPEMIESPLYGFFVKCQGRGSTFQVNLCCLFYDGSVQVYRIHSIDDPTYL